MTVLDEVIAKVGSASEARKKGEADLAMNLMGEVARTLIDEVERLYKALADVANLSLKALPPEVKRTP